MLRIKALNMINNRYVKQLKAYLGPCQKHQWWRILAKTVNNFYFQSFLCCHKGTFKKYFRSRFPSFDLPILPPCSSLFVFEHPPPKLCSFWLELTLSLSISILVKFREKKLMMSTSIFGWTLWSFKKPQWNLYKVDTICTNDKSVRFMAGESDHTPWIDRTEYYNLSWWFYISYWNYNQ